jgi:hypothetical protein
LENYYELFKRDLKANCLIATVVSDNAIEKKVIKDWECLGSFKNTKTGNNVDIMLKKIRKETK